MLIDIKKVISVMGGNTQGVKKKSKKLNKFNSIGYYTS